MVETMGSKNSPALEGEVKIAFEGVKKSGRTPEAAGEFDRLRGRDYRGRSRLPGMARRSKAYLEECCPAGATVFIRWVETHRVSGYRYEVERLGLRGLGRCVSW